MTSRVLLRLLVVRLMIQFPLLPAFTTPGLISLGRVPPRSLFQARQDDGVSEDELLSLAMDSFLRGDYDKPLSPDAPSPIPGLSPAKSIDLALRSLRNIDEPTPAHGAAVLKRFCLPLERSERWGDVSRPVNPWKQLIRGSLSPEMLARKLRDSEFSALLDWSNLDVTEGAYSVETDLVGVPSVAVVSAALHFGKGTEPTIIVFTLQRLGGVWLIDSAIKSITELDNDRKQK